MDITIEPEENGEEDAALPEPEEDAPAPDCADPDDPYNT